VCVRQDEEGPDGKRIGPRTSENVDSFGRGADEGFAVNVETRVEHGADSPPSLCFA
jgi:hypothetical protein